jgi:hypothetical protein
MRNDRDHPFDVSRRRLLVRALSLGLLTGGAGWNLPALAALFGKLPGRLPEGRSIFEIRGEVQVNGQPATPGTVIRPTDQVRTGSGSYAIYAVGSNAFLLRENSGVEMALASGAKQVLRLVTGKLLSVFGRSKQPLELHTPIATIGIRGTGVYAEADPDRTYLCTCYGTTQLASLADPGATEQVQATHHSSRYILKDPEKGKRIVSAPFINHTDLELMTLEALVGRKVPFALPDSEYQAPRRDY